ncbi:Transglycosylase SLT domain-containing protein [Allosphingosinicella indica]|uniref:Transglycosylase SLT domain-containing protein n=1 Tax=Allosphingosinicella indica TaxID=941907 RepID=A0A1X7FYM0_9SPHN|nr:Transglycosylase SLT domain-containing protein [Allosphingosinicella indica]
MAQVANGGAGATEADPAIPITDPPVSHSHGRPAAAGEARSRHPAIVRWHVEIAAASARFGVPEAWIERVMLAESRGRTTHGGAPIRSRKGAMGLMQLMPGTWAELRDRHTLGPDPDHPPDNVAAGAAYLAEMYRRFGYPGLFAAYNAGPDRYARHLATGAPLPAETRAYLAAVAPDASGSGRGVRAGAAAGAPTTTQPPDRLLVVLQRSPRLDADETGGVDAPDPLFVIRPVR